MARRRGEVTYEVHVLQGGRWQMQARYQEWQMDPAIDDARNLDRLPGIECVKVVKEEYDDDEGLSKETIVYQSGAGRGGRSGGGSSAASSSSSSTSSDWDDFDDESGGGRSRGRFGGKRGSENFDDFDDFDDGLKRKKKKKSGAGGTSVQVLVRILLITLISVAIAAALTGITFTMLDGVALKASVKTNLLSALFVGSFLLSLGSMGIPYMRKINLGGSKRPKRPAKASKPARRAAVPAKPARAAKKKPDEDDIDALFAKAEAALKDDTDDEPFEAPQDVPEIAEASVEESPEAPGGMSAEAEKQKKFALQFLNSSLSQLSDEHKKMESFHKFGVNLFMAGACENLGEKRGLESEEVEAILSECVQVMGFKESDATGFAGKYEEYLLNDARYMQMFQSGRNAMNTFRGDEEAGLKHLNQAMREWNKPKTREEVQGPVTVLFTDIAGSTAMTQQLGDAGAQQVVRAHNRVVREALTQYGGREIKHTGDGIMASFSTTSNGVEAAITMQRGVMAHNTANPNLPLHLKIGINAGEPISEDNDLFGTTVQMAARIVDKAQADQIFVSEIVRGICAGKPIRFTNRGAYDMKGFDDGVVLYEVLWQEPQQAAEAPAAAAQS